MFKSRKTRTGSGIIEFSVEPEVSISDFWDHHKWLLRPLKPLYIKFHDDPEPGLFYTIPNLSSKSLSTQIFHSFVNRNFAPQEAVRPSRKSCLWDSNLFLNTITAMTEMMIKAEYNKVMTVNMTAKIYEQFFC